MIIKITREEIVFLREVWNGFILPRRWDTNWTTGKVALSIKRGKNRKLVNGHITSEVQCERDGHWYEFTFKPNNLQKFKALCHV